jgi:hypothetical protein
MEQITGRCDKCRIGDDHPGGVRAGDLLNCCGMVIVHDERRDDRGAAVAVGFIFSTAPIRLRGRSTQARADENAAAEVRRDCHPNGNEAVQRHKEYVTGDLHASRNRFGDSNAMERVRRQAGRGLCGNQNGRNGRFHNGKGITADFSYLDSLFDDFLTFRLSPAVPGSV